MEVEVWVLLDGGGRNLEYCLRELGDWLCLDWRELLKCVLLRS